MRYLVVGGESKERLALLFKLTKISSEDIQAAIEDHLFKGHPENIAVMLNDVTRSNFIRALSRLNEVAGIVESIKELDWDKFKSVK